MLFYSSVFAHVCVCVCCMCTIVCSHIGHKFKLVVAVIVGVFRFSFVCNGIFSHFGCRKPLLLYGNIFPLMCIDFFPFEMGFFASLFKFVKWILAASPHFNHSKFIFLLHSFPLWFFIWISMVLLMLHHLHHRLHHHHHHHHHGNRRINNNNTQCHIDSVTCQSNASKSRWQLEKKRDGRFRFSKLIS